MTTLNQAFIKVYTKQDLGSKSDHGASRMGPRGVQLRVDAGSDALRAPGLVAPAIDAIAGGQDISGQETSTHIVISGEVGMVSGSTDCMVTVGAERVPAPDHIAQGTEQYAASCVRSPVAWRRDSLARNQPDLDTGGVGIIANSRCDPGAGGQGRHEVHCHYQCSSRCGSHDNRNLPGSCGGPARASSSSGGCAFCRPTVGCRDAVSKRLVRGMQRPLASNSPVPLAKEGVTFYPLQLDSNEDLTDWTRPTLLPSLQQIAAGHDLVVLDVGSVLVAWGYGFSRIVKNVIDGVVMVRDRRQADAFAVESAMDRLRRAGLEVVAADNFVS